jgi:hypothetical protein
MSNKLIAGFRRWVDYEKDSHAKTRASLNAIAEELRQSPEFRKAVYLLGHIVAARRMWLFRFGVLKDSIELFPRDVGLAEIPACSGQGNPVDG